jgi:cathepsin L
MKFVLAVLCVAAVASAVDVPRKDVEFLFEAWRIQYGVKYASAFEFSKRLDVFAANHANILEHNMKNETYTMAHNAFSDLTWEEFHAQYVGFGGVPLRHYNHEVNAFADVDVATLPDSVDWTTKGAVTPVKDQGQCGSCWAFSTTGALEGAYFLAKGQLVSFSEQMLVDCDHNGDEGCNGGLMDNAFAWIEQNGGLCKEQDYPYHAVTSTCKKNCTVVPGSAPSKFTDVGHTEAAMAAAVAQQPVAVAIEADQSGFQFYSQGVFSGTCGTNLDHGVLNVGYGVDSASGMKFWKVKNSWGASWGDHGYIKLQKGKAQSGGQCGILLAASYPSY